MTIAEKIAQYLIDLPSEFAKALIAMLPIAKLRGALSVALTLYDLPVWSAYFWSIIGNMIPVFFN